MTHPNPDRTPTPQQVRGIAKRAGLTGGAAAHLLGCDPRTWRRYVGGEREMPLPAWRLLLVVVGEHPEYGPR
jgi:hypothetical protein